MRVTPESVVSGIPKSIPCTLGLLGSNSDLENQPQEQTGQSIAKEPVRDSQPWTLSGKAPSTASFGKRDDPLLAIRNM